MQTKQVKYEAIRCGCRRLLFTVTDKGLEIKCSRCNEVTVIDLEKLIKESGVDFNETN